MSRIGEIVKRHFDKTLDKIVSRRKLYQKSAEIQAITLDQIDIYLKGVRI